MTANGGERVPPEWKVLGLATLLFVAIPVWVWLGSTDSGWVGGSVLAYVVIAYSAARVVRLSASGRKRPSMLMFWLFVYVFFGVCGLAQLSSSSYPWGGRYSDDTVLLTLIVVIVGMVAFDGGSRYFISRQSHQSQGGWPAWRVKPSRLIWLTPVVIALTAVSLQKMGGIDALFQSRTHLEFEMQSRLSSPESAFFRHMANTPIYVLFLLTLLHCKTVERKAKRRLWLCLAVGLGCLTMVMNNPISTPRFQVGAVAIGVFFAAGWSRNRAMAFAAFMVTSMLVIFPVADAYRVERDVDLLALLQESPAAAREITSNGDYDAFQQSLNAVEVTSADGPRLGAQIGGALLFWVPRSLWPTKPVPTGEYVAEAAGYSYLNLSAPLWAEFYVDGTLLLVVLGFFGYGALLGKLDGAFGRSRDTVRSVTFLTTLSLLVAGYQFFILRGSLMPAIAYFCPGLMILLIATFPTITLKPGSAR